MKSASQPMRPRSNYALFLGDLSIFCTEKDIEDAFSSYGEIVNVRIQRSKETSRALSYGFIEFSCETAAVTAMNEMNSFVLKGRPLRIRWAAKRNQPVKSENSALNSAATIFVKFASQTGIIVTEQLLREHFSAYGEVLDTTIRTITIDEAYNRSKGYGFVNFVNSTEQDGLAIAYKASAELQNTTVNGVNYRCEVGYKHQKGDAESVGAYTASTSGTSLAVSTASASYNGGFLPAISPRQFYAHSSSSVNSAGMSCSPSHSSSGPSSPNPAAFFPVNPAAQAGAMSSSASVHSTGSGSASGVYSHHSGSHSYGHGPHSPHPHPVSTIVSTISFVPTPAGMQNMQNVNMYPQQSQQTVPQQAHYAQAVPQVQYAPAQQQYMTQQQYYAQQQQQQQYYAQQQQQQYYQQPAAPYAPHSPNHAHAHGQYVQYPAAQAGSYYGAPQHEQYAQGQQQYYPAQQGYYQQPAQQVPLPMAPVAGAHSQRVRPPAVYEVQPQQAVFLTEQALSQHQSRNRRGSMGPPVANAQSYAQHPHTFMQQVYEPNVPDPAAGPNGRRSQRNISNKSNISEITSATLNELQCDDDEELPEEEEVASPPVVLASAAHQPHTATAEMPAPVLSSAHTSASAITMPAPASTSQTPADHLKSTLQTLATTAPIINCKLTQRRNRSVSGGSNTTEITAAVLYDLQMQEQRLEQEEEEEGFTEPPHTRDVARLTTTPAASPSNVPVGLPEVKVVTPKALVAAAAKKIRAAGSPRSPKKADQAQSLSPVASRRPSQSISPFTLSAATLAQLQADAEAADATAKPERRNKRNISDRSNQSDITAALAYMQLDNEQFASLALEDLDDDASADHSAASVCICGKADGHAGKSGKSATSPYSCPFGTTACSCVYKAMC